MQTKSGISLIVLVITIIVMIILSATIIISLNNTGIIENAQYAKYETDKKTAEEQIKIAVIESYDKTGKVDTVKLKENLKNTGIVDTSTLPSGKDEMSLPAVIKVGEIMFKILENGEVKHIAKDTTPPSITLKMNSEMSKVMVEVTVNNQTEEDGQIQFKYYIKLASESDDKYELKYTGIETTYEFTDLEVYSSYIIKVEAIDISKNVGQATITAGTSCFVAGTKVLTEDGLKNIENIQINEKVWSLNIENNQRELKTVTSLFRGKTDEIYKIKVGSEEITATPKHQFYVVDKGWIRAYELKKGDRLVAKDSQNMEITNIEHKFLDEPVDVYNLTIDSNHNYLITQLELLVHNAPS